MTTTTTTTDVLELRTVSQDGRQVFFRQTGDLRVSNPLGDGTGLHASDAVLVWLDVDDEHDEVVVQASRGTNIDQIRAMRAAMTALQSALDTLERITGC